VILKNCTLLTGNIGEVIQDASIVIKGDKIVDLVTSDRPFEKHADKETYDMQGKIVIPGLSNPYSSFYISELGLLNRLLNSDLPSYEKFLKIYGYSEKIFSSHDFFEKLVRMAAYKSIYNGLTSTVIAIPVSKNLPDMNSSTLDLGIKIKYSPVILSENGINKALKDELLANDNISSITLLGIWGLENEDYDFLRTFMEKGKRIKILMVDFNQEDRYSMLKHGKGLLEILKNQNILSKKIDIVFSVNIGQDLMDLFATKGIRLIKSIRTEVTEIGFSKNILDLLGRGMKIAIGTGLIDYSLFEEAKALLISEKLNGKAKQSIIYNEIERTIFMNNYQFIGEEFGTQLGKVAAGADADLTVLNYKTGKYLFKTNTPFTEIALKVGCDVDIYGTIVGGKVSMWEGKILQMDQTEMIKIQNEINNLSKETEV